MILVLGTPVWAVPSISTTTGFTAADGVRSYMDSGGVWNGTAEVTNTTGDIFQITLGNGAVGAPDPLVNDVAFDIALTLDVPAGFRLPVSPFTVTTAASGGDPVAGNCTAPGGGSISATQAGGAGTPVTFNFPADTNLPAQGTGLNPCRYTLSFGLTTVNVAPFVAAGSHTLEYSFSYNEIDNDTDSEQIVNPNQNIAVRRGDIIVTKTAVSNSSDPDGAYEDGEIAEWTVAVFNNGTGGTFAIQLTDTPNLNFNGATLQLTPPALPPGAPFPVPPGDDQYTLNYLSPGQQVDIGVQAQIAVPASAASCPDLRNDVAAIDRLQNSSSSFDSVVLDLQDPLLAYTPPNFIINFGSPTTVSFTVSNPGIGADGGTARNIELAVPGLTGVTISNVSAEWIYDVPTTTFIYVGVDTIPASGDETMPNGGSSLLQFDAEVNTCGGPTGGFLTWTPSYENICGLNFTPPVRSSTYSVNNFPDLAVDKNVTPVTTNFGQPANYTIDLIGQNVSALTETPGADNDWRVTDTLPLVVGNGNIATVPAGTIITVGATTYTDADTNIAVSGGDTILWEGDRGDLSPALPSITVDFTVDSTNYCPPNPPLTLGNSVTLEYPSCGINIGDTAVFLVNDSPIDSVTQVFTLAGGQNPPFETGRPDTDLTARNGSEPNEGERITFTASYPFPVGYPGVWAGSAFSAQMGTGAGGLAGAPLQLAFMDGDGDNVPDGGEISAVTLEVINPNGADVNLPNLPVGSGAGEVTINVGGDIEIDLAFIEALVGSPSMAEMTLNISYSVTAPEGNLDGDLQPLDDDNIGAFEERVTLSVAGNANSCTNPAGIDFTTGVAAQLVRADVLIGGAIAGTNDAGACGVTTATIDITAPAIGTLNADNIRILLESADYDLPTNPLDFTIGGAGNLAALNPSITFPTATSVQLEVTPNDGDNLNDVSTISFPITLNGTAAGRDLQASIFFDSNHTSPDFGALEDDEDYPNPNSPVTISGPVQTANLDVTFFPPNIILSDPASFADVDPGSMGLE
ncbi:MAG TPA: hypothetical protein VGL10_07705, partial [Gammaproteobacteria bacterium]